MKKNKMMRMASALLVATLLSTSVIAGTFAKYTTSAEGTDTARVAKWGVNITANGSTFATSYDKKGATGEAGTTVKSVLSSTANSEDEDTIKNVVAPGTSGTMAKMTLSGTPEVMVKVNYKGEFKLDDNWKVGDAFYCPLIIKVKNGATGNETTIQQNTTNVTSVETFNKAVNDAIEAYSKEYAANTNLSQQENDSLIVSWEWPFAGSGDGAIQTDAKDTALGDAATAATVTLKVTTTVDQVD